MVERDAAGRRWPRQVLMLLANPDQCGDRPLAEVVEQAVEGGVNVVQLRAKHLPAGGLLSLARQLRGLCGTRALLIVNDRMDVALLSGADGVHLGETAIPVAAARKLLPPSMVVGRSVHSVNAARQAELDGADYVVVGTLFASPSHPEGTPAGVELLEGVRARLSIPVLGIGGINLENIEDCRRAGAAGVAVLSAIAGADDPRRAAAQLAPRARSGGGRTVRLKLNGKEREVPEAASVEELIRHLGIHRMIVVEHNGEILPRDGYAARPLAEGDVLEIVHMVGGG